MSILNEEWIIDSKTLKAKKIKERQDIVIVLTEENELIVDLKPNQVKTTPIKLKSDSFENKKND